MKAFTFSNSYITLHKILRITGFSDFVHRPVFYKLENTAVRKQDLFPSSGEGADIYSVGSLKKS
jgi:hypothetical protein